MPIKKKSYQGLATSVDLTHRVQVGDEVAGHLIDDLAHVLELSAGEGGGARVPHLISG